MRISTPSGTFETNDPAQIENALRQNPEVWVSGEDSYPCLSILISGENACVNYFGTDENDLWLSQSDSSQSVTFYPDGAEWDCPADAVVSVETALECIREFCQTLARPANILWQYGV